MASDQIVEPDPRDVAPDAAPEPLVSGFEAPVSTPESSTGDNPGRAAFVTGGRVSRRLRSQGQRESRQAARTASRFAVVPDVDGPRVRLGCLWFLVMVAAMLTGTVVVAAVVGLIAAIAALQSSQVWLAERVRPNRIVSGICALAMPFAATIDPLLVVIVAVVLVIGAIAAGFIDRRQWTTPLRDAMTTIRTGLLVGLAAASVVLLHRMSLTVALALLVLVSAYETGDYLIGSGASNAVEGPLTGIAAIAVFSFALGVFSPPPFIEEGAWAIGALTAVLCPIGQLVASIVLPVSTARAPALRRLDSLLLTAPVWCAIFWRTVGLPQDFSL